MENKLTETMIQHIHQCANQIEYGEITITINETNKKIGIDVKIKHKFDREDVKD